MSKGCAVIIKLDFRGGRSTYTCTLSMFLLCCRFEEFGCPLSAVSAPHADSAAEDLQ